MIARMQRASDEHLPNAEIEAARHRGEALARLEPRAASARYDAASGKVVVELTNGCTFAFPARALQGLGGASDEALAEVEVLGSGFGLHWESLDADFTVPGLMMGLFGTKAWMREQARRAGQARSPAKSAAARENGKKGGRPRKGAR
jgi:hypothetical protein